MDEVNVLVVSRIDLTHDYLAEIASVNPRIAVKDGLRQFVDELQRQDPNGSRVQNLAKQLEMNNKLHIPESRESLDELLAEAEVIFGTGRFPDNLFERAPKLKWIHVGSVGIDYLPKEMFTHGVTITNGRGSTAIPIAEHITAFMFALAQNTTQLLLNKQEKVWRRFTKLELRDRMLGIIGLGSIGRELATIAKGIGMRVIATRKSAVKREQNVSGVDEIYPLNELPQFLKKCDFVSLSVPLTSESRGMIGEAELKAMKPSAFLINVARGAVVQEPVLIKALKEHWIAGAALDVFQKEPLPEDSTLWELPNVILSPHMAGTSDRRSQRVINLFCENLKRYLSGDALLNVIDLKKAY